MNQAHTCCERISWAHEGYDPGNTIGILEKDLHSSLDALAALDHEQPDAFDAALLAAIRAMPPHAP